MFFHLNFVLRTLPAKLKKMHFYRCFLNIFFACYLFLYMFMIWMSHKICLVNFWWMFFRIGFHFYWFKKRTLSTIVLQLDNLLVYLPTSFLNNVGELLAISLREKKRKNTTKNGMARKNLPNTQLNSLIAGSYIHLF